MDLGDRLRRARQRADLTQRELAQTSGVSVSLIRKIEQGEIERTRLETLHLLARALHVPTSALQTEPDAEQPASDNVERWAPVRRALMGQDAINGAQAATVPGVQLALDGLMPAFRANRYAEVAGTLPDLIRDAHALGDDGRAVRTRILTMAGTLLTHVHMYDMAELALQRALDDADDRFAASGVAHNLTWLMVRRGDLEGCIRMATRWADELEPRLSRATHREIAAWGWMLIRVGMAAVRDNQPGEAVDALRLARAAALVVGHEFQPSGDFLRPFGPLLVIAKTAEMEMILDRPDRVIALSESIPSTAIRPESDNHNRHRLDVANAQVRLGRLHEAVATLTEIHGNAPEWMAEQRYARSVVGTLFDKRRTLTPEMRLLGDAVRLEL